MDSDTIAAFFIVMLGVCFGNLLSALILSLLDDYANRNNGDFT